MRVSLRALRNVPYSRLIRLSAIGRSEVGVGPLTKGGFFVSFGALLAAGVSSPALAQAAPQPDQVPTQQAAQPASQQPPSPPSLGPSMTGPLQLNSNPLHVD